jgi:hypothetical protein
MDEANVYIIESIDGVLEDIYNIRTSRTSSHV